MAIFILLFSFLSAACFGTAAYMHTGSLVMAALGYSWGGAGTLAAIFLVALLMQRAEDKEAAKADA